ncbi:hypothetical protein, partial [Actinospica sp.]|uniref:hypothetical protein n=1 Tax=Actinospica sp. TaxID=1872142 RepID=UPI002D11AFE9
DLRQVIELCHVMLDEAPSDDIVMAHVERWAKVLGFGIAVYARDDRLLAASARAADPNSLPAGDAAVARASAELVPIGDGRCVIPIRIGPDHYGTLVPRPAGQLTDRDTMVLRLAVRIIAACIGRGPGQPHGGGDRQRDALLAQLLRSDAPTPSRSVLARLRELASTATPRTSSSSRAPKQGRAARPSRGPSSTPAASTASTWPAPRTSPC